MTNIVKKQKEETVIAYLYNALDKILLNKVQFISK